jgi:hypothetical protein
MARIALRSGSRSDLRDALELLPTDGNKAELLRAEIRTRLADGGVPGAHHGEDLPEAGVVIVSGDYHFCFTVSDFHVATLFLLRPKGGTVEIAINSSHSAFSRLLADGQEGLAPAAERSLMAWAKLLLRASSDKKREQIEELCAQWADFLAESPAEPYWGHGHVG